MSTILPGLGSLVDLLAMMESSQKTGTILEILSKSFISAKGLKLAEV